MKFFWYKFLLRTPLIHSFPKQAIIIYVSNHIYIVYTSVFIYHRCRTSTPWVNCFSRDYLVASESTLRVKHSCYCGLYFQWTQFKLPFNRSLCFKTWNASWVSFDALWEWFILYTKRYFTNFPSLKCSLCLYDVCHLKSPLRLWKLKNYKSHFLISQKIIHFVFSSKMR